MMMKKKDVKTIRAVMADFERSAKRSYKEGYPTDGASSMFFSYALKLLLELKQVVSNQRKIIDIMTRQSTKKKRPPTAYNKFSSRKLKEGLSMREIARQWKEKKMTSHSVSYPKEAEE